MTGTGLSAQVGFVKETTAGTRVVPTRFLELVNESVKVNRQTMRSNGIRAGRRRASRMRNGATTVGGPLTVVMAPQGMGALLELCMGGVATSGAGPYTHVFTDGTLPTGTFQIGKPRTLSTTVDPLDVLGATVTDWSFSTSASDTTEAEFSFSINGMTATTAQSLATASYPTGYQGFVFTEAVVNVGGSQTDVTDVSISSALGIQGDRLRIGSGTAPRRATQNGYRVATGTLTADYTATTLRDAYISGADLALSVVFTSGATSLTFAGNIKPVDDGTPNVSGPENLTQPFAFEFYSPTSDAAALTVTLVNADSAP